MTMWVRVGGEGGRRGEGRVKPWLDVQQCKCQNTNIEQFTIRVTWHVPPIAVSGQIISWAVVAIAWSGWRAGQPTRPVGRSVGRGELITGLGVIRNSIVASTTDSGENGRVSEGTMTIRCFGPEDADHSQSVINKWRHRVPLCVCSLCNGSVFQGSESSRQNNNYNNNNKRMMRKTRFGQYYVTRLTRNTIVTSRGGDGLKSRALSDVKW